MRAFIMTTLILAGCAAGPGSRQLADSAWRVVDINGVPVIAGSAATLRLDDGQASGSTSCNSFSAPYQRSSRDRIRFGPINTTRAACADAALADQERRFLSTLEAATGYSFYGDGSLSLVAGDGRAIRFRRGD